MRYDRRFFTAFLSTNTACSLSHTSAHRSGHRLPLSIMLTACNTAYAIRPHNTMLRCDETLLP
jgi:hypothetical protein